MSYVVLSLELRCIFSSKRLTEVYSCGMNSQAEAFSQESETARKVRRKYNFNCHVSHPQRQETPTQQQSMVPPKKIQPSVLSFGRGQKNQINRAPMSDFHSLSTYVDRINFKSYFPRQLGHSYFLFPRVFYDFFSLKLIGPRRNLVWFGGYQNECFSLIEQLTFQLYSFSQKLVPTQN